jgi:hypothetical protein
MTAKLPSYAKMTKLKNWSDSPYTANMKINDKFT